MALAHEFRLKPSLFTAPEAIHKNQKLETRNQKLETRTRNQKLETRN
jgi:hypothetical protein